MRPNNLQTAAVHSAQRRQRRERRHDPRGARGNVERSETNRRAPVTPFNLVTTSAGATITETEWYAVWRCKHCNAWPDEHVDGVHCLFAPTDYTAPGPGEDGECIYTGPMLPSGDAPAFRTITGATTNTESSAVTFTGWAVSYTVKP